MYNYADDNTWSLGNDLDGLDNTLENESSILITG